MLNHRRWLLMLVFWFFQTGAFASAEGEDNCMGRRCTGKIQFLYPHSDGNVVNIGMDGNEKNLLCMPEEGVMITLSPTQPLFAQIYDTLLMAVMHNRVVTVRVNTDRKKCRVVYVQIYPEEN